MKKKSESRSVKNLDTDSLTDIAMSGSVRDGGGIRCCMQGENVKHLRPVDSGRLMVQDEDVEKAVSQHSTITFYRSYYGCSNEA
jgi:hypothetical protein